jgi:hypothetical protein
MFFNIFGNRILMGAGGLTYVFYVIAQYVAAKDPSFGWLAILSGAVLGIGAGLFWTAQVRERNANAKTSLLSNSRHQF